MAELPPFQYENVRDTGADEVTSYQKIVPPQQDRPESSDECGRCEVRIWKEKRVRAMECSCDGRKYVSSTIRQLGKEPESSPSQTPTHAFTSGYLDEKAKRINRLNTPREIAEILHRVIFGVEEAIEKRAEGLIVVAGSTNSGKSTIVRAVIHQYLAARLKAVLAAPAGGKPPRRPHLVTVEDPIESRFAEPDEFEKRGIDYTPRQIGSDVMSLDDAIRDALRQTPDVFYVGEVRNRDDWRALLEFAGTGHLAVTTTHSGTLTEALRNIFRSTGARRPADRSAIAVRIKAVVHLRSDEFPPECKIDGGPSMMQVPTVWRGKPGAMGLMEYGLSSVLPANPPSMQDRPVPDEACLGRMWFTDQLLHSYCVAEKKDAATFNSIRLRAAGWDLQGA